MRKRRRGDIAFGDEDERPDIWQRLSRVLLLFVSLLTMGGILSLFLPELERQQMLDQDLDGLAEIRDAKIAKRDKLMAGLEWMRTDPDYLETFARDRLDLYREGEFVIRIEDEKDRDKRAIPVQKAPVLKPAPAVGQ